MKNKEVIDKLQDYLLQQDKATVARLAASLMIDFNRIYTIESLPNEERECLLTRIEWNALQLRSFIVNGPSKDFTLIKMNSDKGEK